jgi:hemerythrin-like domain-containing protein
MKRSAALAPLSRDHHQALVIASELSTAAPHQAAQAAERFVRFLSDHELSHFALEESVLLPSLPQDGRGQGLANRARTDHAFLRAALTRLQAAPADASAEFLHEVGSRLQAHVRMEERELFPFIEASLEPAALERLGSRLAHRH